MQNPSPRVLRFVCALAIIASLTAAALGQVPSSTWVQLNPVHNPPRRGAPAMAYDPVSQKIVMFGGYGRLNYYGDTWTFDGTDWKNQRLTVAPSPRAAAGMAFDVTLQKLVLFGGWNGQNYLGDTWLWDGATSTWAQTSPAKSPKPMTRTQTRAGARGATGRASSGPGPSPSSRAPGWAPRARTPAPPAMPAPPPRPGQVKSVGRGTLAPSRGITSLRQLGPTKILTVFVRARRAVAINR